MDIALVDVGEIGDFTFSSSDNRVLSVDSSGNVKIVGVGTATLTAKQDANANFESGSVAVSVTVSKGKPVYSWTIPTKTFGDAAFDLSAPTSTSSGAITYSVDDATIATVTAAGRVTILKAGTVTITATQVATDFHVASTTTATFTIDKLAPTLGSFVLPSKTYGDGAFNVTAPTSTSTGSFSYVSSNPSVATINASTGLVTVIGAGTSTITATQAATTRYTATSITTTLTVGKAAPALGSFVLAPKYAGDPAFTVSAPTSSSSGQFSYTTSNAAVATVNGSTGLVTVVGVGTTTMTATQASTTNYLGAEVAVIFEVLPPRVVPTVGALSIAAARVGDTAFQVTSPVSSSSGSFTYASSNPAVATVTATGSISPIAIGTTTITATQAATTSHSSVVRTATFRVVESTRARRVKKIAMSDQSGYLLSSNGTLFRASHGGYAKQSHWNETYSDVFAGREICAITTGGALKCAANVWASMVGVAGFETDVQQVSVGYQATCAIKFGGELRCWGSNGQGQVGNGTTVTQPTPVTILNGVSSVSAGFYHSCAIMLDTTLRCWGANWSGQLGDGTFTQRNSPVVVPGLTGVTSVATNFESTCVVASGGVKCWGGNYYGELGTSTGSLTYSTSPVTPDGLTSGQGSVSSGGRTTCALSVGGAVNCWGMNRFGSVGDGTYVNRFSPVAIAVLQSGVLSVAIGNESNCAVTDDYLQFCWGGNYSGQLANGRRNNLPSPTWGLIGDLSSGA